MEDAFKHFDKDGSGFITSEGFSTGLREMGVFQEFSQEEVEQVQHRVEDISSGTTRILYGPRVSLHFCFVLRLVWYVTAALEQITSSSCFTYSSSSIKESVTELKSKH